MTRRPRAASERLLSKRATIAAVVQGLGSLAACLAVYLLARDSHTLAAARALLFVTLVTGLLCTALVNRSWSRSPVAMLNMRNPALWWILAGGVVLLTVSIGVPSVRFLFQFQPAPPLEFAASALAGVLGVAWFEPIKLTSWWRREAPTKMPSSGFAQ